MSTKNLARTIVEGGRYGWSKFELRRYTRRERREVRALMMAAKRDISILENSVLPIRQKAYKEFHDRLNPAYRWFHSQIGIGKSWNAAYSYLKRRYDIRTIKGWHLIDSHIKSLHRPATYQPLLQKHTYCIVAWDGQDRVLLELGIVE